MLSFKESRELKILRVAEKSIFMSVWMIVICHESHFFSPGDEGVTQITMNCDVSPVLFRKIKLT